MFFLSLLCVLDLLLRRSSHFLCMLSLDIIVGLSFYMRYSEKRKEIDESCSTSILLSYGY
jgi:hypothetical protein